MVNLEWLRSFRVVYKTKSLSKASEILHISQPTVSQHIQALESHLNKKLFKRKSKGVLETDEGRLLNTLVAGSIESLEEVENIISQRYAHEDTVITIGISEHLYKSMLCHQVLGIGKNVHIKFGTKQDLFREVEDGTLLYAILPDGIDTFDAICYPLFDQHLVLVKTADIDLGDVKKMYNKNPNELARVLTNQTWYAHNSASSFIKLFWLNVFNYQRPAVIPNYVIPNEFETLFQLSQGSGLSVANETVANHFVKNGRLEVVDIPPIFYRKMSLMANKKKGVDSTAKKIVSLIDCTK